RMHVITSINDSFVVSELAEYSTFHIVSNSHSRAHICMPFIYLLVDVLRVYHLYLGPEFTAECPTGSGRSLNLDEVADEISRRLIAIFVDTDGSRPVFGTYKRLQMDPSWHDLIPFHE